MYNQFWSLSCLKLVLTGQNPCHIYKNFIKVLGQIVFVWLFLKVIFQMLTLLRVFSCTPPPFFFIFSYSMYYKKYYYCSYIKPFENSSTLTWLHYWLKRLSEIQAFKLCKIYYCYKISKMTFPHTFYSCCKTGFTGICRLS